MEIQWDERKNRINRKKHGLSFDEAKELFEAQRDYLEIYDAEHSDFEDRFLAIGEIQRGIAVVVFTERHEDVIRIIGARFATKGEQEKYHLYMSKDL